ncbi:MAG: growth inhibitor PemK [Gammaproteobacteria bacterium]|nr:growth inhibitor PemK [Gammaproteobacteria bacterium]
MVGRIYLAKIYFTDLSEYKFRPVLILKELGEDCICLQLTSQLHHQGILIGQKDLIDGSLKKESMLLIPKNFTIHQSILTKYLAQVAPSVLASAFERLCDELGCSDKQEKNNDSR